MDNTNANIDLKEPKREKYTATDSSKMFLYALLIPEVSLLFIMFISLFVLRMFSVDLEIVKVSMSYSVFLTLCSNAILLFICYYYNKVNNIDTKKALKINTKLDYKIVLLVIAMAVVAVFGSVMLISLFDTGLASLGYKAGTSYFRVDTWYNYLICLFILCVVPAFVEELIYRGVVQNGLSNTMGKKAILLTAIFFTLMHGMLNQTIYQFVLGLLLCVVLYMTDNIVYSMILHLANNALVTTLSFLGNFVNVTFFSSWNIVALCVVSILVFIVAVAILLALLYVLKKMTNKDKVKAVLSSSDVNIVEIENVDNTRRLTKMEKIYLWLGVCVALVMWITNTVSAFM